VRSATVAQLARRADDRSYHPSQTKEIAMTPDRPSPCIVVGYDGSPSSRAALGLAVRRAGAGKLFLVHAYDAPADYWGGEHYDALLNVALTRGERLLAQAAELEPGLAGVAYELELIAGRPADVIATVAETRAADEIIVGTRGFGPLRGLLGSVAHGLIHQANRPVTVIPEAALDHLSSPADTVAERVGA
jgi:nucleotide-binding universal stress UspA family protein